MGGSSCFARHSSAPFPSLGLPDFQPRFGETCHCRCLHLGRGETSCHGRPSPLQLSGAGGPGRRRRGGSCPGPQRHPPLSGAGGPVVRGAVEGGVVLLVTPLVMIKVGRFCIPGQVSLLSRYSLVLTCVVCLEIYQEQLYCFRVRGDKCLAGKSPSFPSKIRLPSTTNAIPIPEPR